MHFFRYYFSILCLVPIIFTRVYKYCDGEFSTCEERNLEKEEKPDIFQRTRDAISKKVRSKLSSPHSEILLGMTVGINDFSNLPRFYDLLCNAGTVHVVVVSGFNISLVFSLIGKALGSLYRLKNLVIAQIFVLIYALFSGFDPPVVRSFVMGSIVSWGKYYGRDLDALRVLLFSAQVMILINPLYLFSLSFQLSLLSTLGLMIFSKFFEKLTVVLFKRSLEDLTSTLAATVLVWPLISLKFGRVSLISPVVNVLVLWTVSLATVWGGALVFFEMIFDVPFVFWYPVFGLIDIFVKVCEFFGKMSFSSVQFTLKSNLTYLYYTIVLVLIVVYKKCRRRV